MKIIFHSSLFGLFIGLTAIAKSETPVNDDVPFTFFFKAQSLVEDEQQFAKTYKFPVSLLALTNYEAIAGAIVSRNKEFVAVLIEQYSKSGATNPSRIAVVSVGTKQRNDYPCSFPANTKWWISDLGAINNLGSQLLVNIAKPIGDFVKREWCIVEVRSMNVIETGLDGVFKNQ